MPRVLSLAVLATTILLVSGPTARAAPPSGFFGVAPALPPPPGDYPRMAQGGIGTMRFLISWPAIQPTPNAPYNWSEVDKQVASAAANLITPLPFFYGMPRWAGDGACAADPLCELWSPTHSALGRAGWDALLRAAVARYGPTGTFWSDTTDRYTPPYLPIRAWQIGNENNSRVFAKPIPSVGAYYRLLKISKPAITSVDPGAKLITAGLFGLPSRPGIPVDKFLDRLYAKKGAKRLFDAVAVHPYAPNTRKVVLQLEQALDTMEENKDRKTRLLITEIGWGSAVPGSAPRWLGSLLFGPEGQAAMVSKVLGFLAKRRRRFHLDTVVYFTWRDTAPGTGASCYLCESGGLLNADGSAKPALSAFAQVAG